MRCVSEWYALKIGLAKSSSTNQSEPCSGEPLGGVSCTGNTSLISRLQMGHLGSCVPSSCAPPRSLYEHVRQKLEWPHGTRAPLRSMSSKQMVQGSPSSSEGCGCSSDCCCTCNFMEIYVRLSECFQQVKVYIPEQLPLPARPRPERRDQVRNHFQWL